ncbi:hypothetical protein ASZ78_011705 [Callipepla squamata]|uniref:Uncharacterized protein n=1 Tax=Callipepla squamata TaxID=9009 RepID=A0A226MLI2_CALSU|nr:hypothetical protein ASZ78_011705 [Callipepla squamata]
MRGNAQVQKFIQNLMGRKRSSNPGPLKTDAQEKGKENSNEDLCYMWLYQSFLNSRSVCSDKSCPLWGGLQR